jgi:hypothetical protein
MNCPSCNETIDEAVTRMGLALHPTCEAVDTDPNLVAMEIFSIIQQSVLNQPRSAQKMIGPSEMGQPCTRRIGYKLAGVEPQNNSQGSVAWKPAVGTMMHAALGDMMARHELDTFPNSGLSPRWHVEEQVTIGDVAGETITGNCDLFDAHNGVVVDFKTTSSRTMSKFVTEGPGLQYETQCHLYGLGWENAGHDVKHVMLIWLVRDGSFTERHVWTAPYDRAAALDALERIRIIKTSLDTHGPETILPHLEAVASYCNNCPWYRRGETDLGLGCPGVDMPADELEQMFA